MDAQSRGEESTALLALAAACVAQAAGDYDNGVRAAAVPNRAIEENFWRAIRYGMDGKLIDIGAAEELPARSAVESLLDWTAEARSQLQLDTHLEELPRMLDEGNGAQRQWRAHEAGDSDRSIFAASVVDTCSTYGETADVCPEAVG